jgi:hypothetical protein
MFDYSGQKIDIDHYLVGAKVKERPTVNKLRSKCLMQKL